MLSYLNEENNSEQQENIEKETSRQAIKQQDYIAPSAGNNNVRNTTILLSILFIVGGAVLFFMIKKVTPQAADAAVSSEQAVLEARLKQQLDVNMKNADAVDQLLQKFQRESPQVNSGRLKKNPFHIHWALEKSDRIKAVEQAKKLEDARLKEMALSANKVVVKDGAAIEVLPVIEIEPEFKLQAVMQIDDGYCCMLNDKLYNVGQEIEGYKIIGITKKSVTLDKSGKRKELKTEY